MSDGAINTLVGGVVSLVGAYLTYRIHLLDKNVGRVEVEMNSMKDALVATTGESEHAKGVLQGGAEERRDQGRPPLPREEPIPPSNPRNGPQL